jgi:hypothetical protein
LEKNILGFGGIREDVEAGGAKIRNRNQEIGRRRNIPLSGSV